MLPYDIPMVEPISAPPSTPSHSTSGDPYPLPPKQKPEELNHIVSQKQESSDLLTPFPMAPTSDPCVVPSSIPSDCYSNQLFSTYPYVLPNHSP